MACDLADSQRESASACAAFVSAAAVAAALFFFFRHRSEIYFLSFFDFFSFLPKNSFLIFIHTVVPGFVQELPRFLGEPRHLLLGLRGLALGDGCSGRGIEGDAARLSSLLEGRVALGDFFLRLGLGCLDRGLIFLDSRLLRGSETRREEQKRDRSKVSFLLFLIIFSQPPPSPLLCWSGAKTSLVPAFFFFFYLELYDTSTPGLCRSIIHAF